MRLLVRRDELFRIEFDDGDVEDFDAKDLKEGMQLYTIYGEEQVGCGLSVVGFAFCDYCVMGERAWIIVSNTRRLVEITLWPFANSRECQRRNTSPVR